MNYRLILPKEISIISKFISLLDVRCTPALTNDRFFSQMHSLYAPYKPLVSPRPFFSMLTSQMCSDIKNIEGNRVSEVFNCENYIRLTKLRTRSWFIII